MKKTNVLLFMVLAACASVLAVHAQSTNASGLPSSIPDLPMGKDAIWLALIAPITFTVTWLFGKIPPLPKVILPWITPLVGIGIGAVFNWATTANLPWWSSAGAGAIATTIYEAAKGLSKAGPESALTPTPPNPANN